MKTQSLLLFDIPFKVKDVVTDHASNMPKAFNLPGYQENADDSDEEEDNEMIAVSTLIVIHLIGLQVEHHVLQLAIKDRFKKAC